MDVGAVKFHGSWGRIAADAEAWIQVPTTATASELARTSNGLARTRSAIEVGGSGFEAVRSAIAGLQWFPPDFLRAAVASDGVTVLQRCRVAPFAYLDAPVRVIDRVVEAHRVVVTVVTVAGHPERGVERYAAVLDPALDRVMVSVDKAWALADPLARLGWPFAAWFQAHATGRSLARLRRLAAAR